jgi:hypothetical protein
MEVTHTETNRGNSAIIVDGYIYHKMNVLKSGDVVYRCIKSKSCKKLLKPKMTIPVTWSQTNENLKPKSFGYVYEKHLETYLKDRLL